MKRVKIGKQIIGENSKTFIIAELSANHNNDYATAVKTIKAAKKAGADAIKLQTYTADSLTIDCKNKYFKIKGGTLWDGISLYELYQKAFTPWDWQPKLAKVAKKLDFPLFSTPFDKNAVDLLDKMNVPAYKIASFEANDLELVEYVASKKKPILVSCGVSSFDEINDLVKTCKKAGNDKLILLKCTSAYPALISDANLNTMLDMKKKFKAIIGVSDHTQGISVPIAAVSLGAKVVEKHFILDRKMGGPDAAFSLEPAEFRQMVDKIREVEDSFGKITYHVSKKRKMFKRSLFVVQDMDKGEVFTRKNIRAIRPGDGMAPKYIGKVLGKKAKVSIKRGKPLKESLIN
jgi:pseudaminic acid synthase